MLEHAQALLRVGIDHVGHQQVAIRPAMAAAHAAPQLVQLRQPELVGAAHEHRVGVRHVEPRFDDHGRHEDVHLAAHEARHHVVERRLFELAVRHRHACPRRRERPHPLRHRIDRLDTIVHEVHLTRPVELPRQRLLDQPVVPRLDEGDDG